MDNPGRAQVVRIRWVAMEVPHVSERRFETYYAPGQATKYAARSWIVAAVVAAVGIPVTWFTFAGNPQWWVLLVVGLIFAFLLVVTIAAAVGAPGKWGADGRLALAIGEAGITLPRVGTLTWDELYAIRVVDTGDVHGNIAFRAWEALTGSSSNRFMTFWVEDADAVATRTGGAANAARNLGPLDGRQGFDGVWAEGLRDPGWDATVAAVVEAADRHGIPVHGRTQ